MWKSHSYLWWPGTFVMWKVTRLCDQNVRRVKKSLVLTLWWSRTFSSCEMTIVFVMIVKRSSRKTSLVFVIRIFVMWKVTRLCDDRERSSCELALVFMMTVNVRHLKSHSSLRWQRSSCEMTLVVVMTWNVRHVKCHSCLWSECLSSENSPEVGMGTFVMSKGTRLSEESVLRVSSHSSFWRERSSCERSIVLVTRTVFMWCHPSLWC